MFALEKVDINSKIHLNELFKILSSRKYNISHNKKVNFEDHENFVKNNPYKNWYLILNKKNYEGTVYITYSNTIGINFSSPTTAKYKEAINLILKKHKPLKPKKSERSSYFIINSNPDNFILQQTLEELKFKLIQKSYAFIKY